MLFDSLDHVLGTRTKVQILRALSHLDAPVSGREAQRLGGARSVSGSARALDELADLGILHRDEAGGAHLYRFNREHVLASPLLQLFEAEHRVFMCLRDTLRERLTAEDVAEAVRSVIVFGSAARGEARPDSDVDLLVVVNGEESTARVRAAMYDARSPLQERLGLRLSPYILTVERVITRYRDGDQLMHSVATEGRKLLGESFNDLVEKW